MLDRKIRYCSLPEAIREHFLWGARSIVIAGTHGKTTTTSLTGWLLTHGGLGSERARRRHRAQFRRATGSSYRIGQGRDFVIEGDEYDSAFFDKTAKFLKYLPDIAVINNIEFDHADIYADLDAVTLAFRRLVNLVPRTRPAAARRRQPATPRRCGRGGVARSRRSGFGDGVDWQAHDLDAGDGASTRFKRAARRAPFGDVRVCRCSARTTCATRWRRSPSATDARHRRERRSPRACGRFAGVKRRLEIVGVADGVTVYDDFAHHPTAVAETLAALRAAHPGRARLGGVRAALGLVVPPRLPGRLRARVRRRRRSRARAGVPIDAAGAERLSVAQLVADLNAPGRRARARRRRRRHRRRPSSRERRDGDVVVIMSNGGFGGIHRKLVARLQQAGVAA